MKMSPEQSENVRIMVLRTKEKLTNLMSPEVAEIFMIGFQSLPNKDKLYYTGQISKAIEEQELLIPDFHDAEEN
jgi:hypothetical protein